jgi:hypothetical protein
MAPDGTKVFHCSNRDLYKKYNWPAQSRMQDAIRAYIAK